ncbi:hypothetical protein EIKCOROL_00153 [Eikenella corrodens ATCC 23834]|uniref:Uncharacterized protein n=1 Tax=Eikenella corrodens ATCC 23834 TaxID=546274 RepID=C0DS36_EIKCO|nr:hypothetical protein EIKCOROL_00153 [Eikenella corrodens ATCC 23834]
MAIKTIIEMWSFGKVADLPNILLRHNALNAACCASDITRGDLKRIRAASCFA